MKNNHLKSSTCKYSMTSYIFGQISHACKLAKEKAILPMCYVVPLIELK